MCVTIICFSVKYFLSLLLLIGDFIILNISSKEQITSGQHQHSLYPKYFWCRLQGQITSVNTVKKINISFTISVVLISFRLTVLLPCISEPMYRLEF